MTARYAIYFTPDDSSELAVFGATVLRRTPRDAGDWLNPQLPVNFPTAAAQPSLSVWKDQIQKPALYGFHATIKAPFELAQGQTAEKLRSDLESFCKIKAPISLKGLMPVRSCRYDALAFAQQPDALAKLAVDCVTQFETYRAPLRDADIQRRKPDSLTGSELKNLHQYGYPYVLEDFNFHMTLSGQHNRDDNTYFEWLQELYKAMVTKPPTLDRLCVFYQPDRETAFVRIEECTFGNEA